MPVEQQTADTKVQNSPTPDLLPAFIPRSGHDKGYAAKHPGWESYTGRQFNFRVFKVGGKLKALQVIAGRGSVIPSSLVNTVLTELAGSSNYQVRSRENNSGFLVSKGIVADKADLIFYKKRDTLRAFVVSLR